MKKLFACIALVFSLSVVAFNASAQGGGGMKENMRQRLKDSVGLSDVMVDSVMAIRQDMQPKMRAVMTDQSLQEEDKRAKMETLKKEMYERLKTVGLTTDQVKKIKEMDEHMRGQMKQRKPE